MKVTVPEISFHNRDPILSVDVQHNSPDGITRMATGGTDTHVVIWQVTPLPSGGVSVEALCDLIRHNRAVNAVRFSPDGTLLVSADDEAAIIVWKCQDASAAAPDLFADDSEDKNKETWMIYKMLRGHIEDVYDLSWSRCSSYLISGSIDNSAIMWDVAKGKNIGLLKDHKNFVQGVAWDPLGQYVATLSSDRVLRWFSISNKRVLHKAYKATLPRVMEDGTVQEVSTRLFHDDTLKSFCRRLSFSPDGLLLAAPSGLLAEEEHHCNAVHIFTRLCPTRPVLYLPTKDKPTLAVRFCPLLFKLRGRETEHVQSVFALPYRMVLAVACQNSVVLHDTQQLLPFARMSNMHYTRLTDLAWSDDGRILAISSTDGYCSLTYFNEGELGEEYVPPKKIEEVTTTQTPAKAVVEDSAVTPQTHIKKPTLTPKMTKSDIKKNGASSNKTGNASIDKMILNQIAKSKQQALDAADDDSNDCVFVCEHTPGKTDASETTAVSAASKTTTVSAASKTTAVSAVSKTTAVTAASVSTEPNVLVARRAPKSNTSLFGPKATKPEKTEEKLAVTDENTTKVDSPKLVSNASDANKSKTESKEKVKKDDEEEELNDLISESGEIDSDASESIGSKDSEEEDDDDASMASFDNKDDEGDMGVTEIDHSDDSCEIMEVDRVSPAQKEAHVTQQEFNIGRRIKASSICDKLSSGKTSTANKSESNDHQKLNAREVKKRELTGKGASKENVNVDDISSVNVIAVKRKPDSRPGRRVPLISLPRPGSAATPAASVSAPRATASLAPSTAVMRPSEPVPLDCLIESTSDLCLKLDGDITMSSPVKTSGSAATASSATSNSDETVAGPSGNTVTQCTSSASTTPSAPRTPSASGPSSAPGTPSTAKAHRRVSLITLASPKAKKTLASAPGTTTSKEGKGA